MRLTEILKIESVRVPLAARTKAEAIEELITLVAASGHVRSPERLRQAVLEREAARSTGMGEGVAIPHGKTDGVTAVVSAFGRTAEPLDYGAVDGKPVTFIWMLTSPPDQTSPHIAALARISKVMSNPAVRRRLAQAQSAEEIYEIIAEQDERL